MQNKVKFRNILLIIVISTGFVAGAYFIYNTDTVNRDKTNIESVNKVEDIKVKDKKKDNKIDRDIEERNNKIEARESEEARENRVATIVDNIRGEYRGIRRQPLKYNPIELPSIPNIPSIPNTPAIPSVPVNPIIPTIPNPPVIPPDTDNPTDPGEDNGGDDSTPILVAGDKDPTFDTGLPPEFDDEVYALAVQSDGKIIVGGEFESYRGVEANYIIRLNTDGSRDTSFDIGTGFDDDVLTLAIQSDGKILVGGEFESYKGESANRIIRLNSNGSRDTSFDSIANLTASTYEEWSGEISQVAVYERALSEVEIQQNFNSYSYRYGLSEEQNEISTVNPGLITYLDAGNVLSYSGSGDSWYDLSGNNNNAKLYNGVTHNTNGGGALILMGLMMLGLFS